MFETKLSPYSFANQIKVRPQMIYNYISKGYIVCEINELGKKVLTPEVMNEFVEKRNKKNEKNEQESEV